MWWKPEAPLHFLCSWIKINEKNKKHFFTTLACWNSFILHIMHFLFLVRYSLSLHWRRLFPLSIGRNWEKKGTKVLEVKNLFSLFLWLCLCLWIIISEIFPSTLADIFHNSPLSFYRNFQLYAVNFLVHRRLLNIWTEIKHFVLFFCNFCWLYCVNFT